MFVEVYWVGCVGKWFFVVIENENGYEKLEFKFVFCEDLIFRFDFMIFLESFFVLFMEYFICLVIFFDELDLFEVNFVCVCIVVMYYKVC